VPVPPEKQLLDLGAAPTRFRVPETDGQNNEKRMYLNRITLIGFIGSGAERKAANANNIAIFSLANRPGMHLVERDLNHSTAGQHLAEWAPAGMRSVSRT